MENLIPQQNPNADAGPNVLKAIEELLGKPIEDIGFVNWIRNLLRQKGHEYYQLGFDYGRVKIYGPANENDVLIASGAQEVHTAIGIRIEGHEKEAEAKFLIVKELQEKEATRLEDMRTEESQLSRTMKPKYYPVILLALCALCLLGEFPLAIETFAALLNIPDFNGFKDTSVILGALGLLACVTSIKETIDSFWNLQNLTPPEIQDSTPSTVTNPPQRSKKVWIIPTIRVVISLLIIASFIGFIYAIAEYRSENLAIDSLEKPVEPKGNKSHKAYFQKLEDYMADKADLEVTRTVAMKNFFRLYGLYFPISAAFLLLSGLHGLAQRNRFNALKKLIEELEPVLDKINAEYLKRRVLFEEAQALSAGLTTLGIINSYQIEFWRIFKQGHLAGQFPAYLFPEGPDIMDKVLNIRNFDLL